MRFKGFVPSFEEICMNRDYAEVLEKEDKVISEVLVEQNRLREAVIEKDWIELVDVTARLNFLMDSFNELDAERESLASEKKSYSEEENNLLALVRGKLVQCRSENKALGDYIDITKGFVQKTIDEALPQSKNRLYSKKGYIVQQPESVVVNTLF